MGIWNSLAKSFKLRSVSKRLAADPDRLLTIDDIRETSPYSRNKRAAERDLLDLVEGDPILASVMARHGATRADLSNTYNLLLASGCGQWVRGHWVAASALVFGPTLDFVLTTTKSGGISLDAMGRLLDYFKRGEVGPIQ